VHQRGYRGAISWAFRTRRWSEDVHSPAP
jgi:hypothetical protein